MKCSKWIGNEGVCTRVSLHLVSSKYAATLEAALVFRNECFLIIRFASVSAVSYCSILHSCGLRRHCCGPPDESVICL